MSISLFRSTGGLELYPEVCLRVAEELVLVDPKSINNLLATSKSWHKLLKTYEKSICSSILTREPRLEWVNIDQHEVLSSRIPLGSISVTAYTYPWASEMLSRVHTMEFLISNELTDMVDHHAQSWPTLDVSKDELGQRIARFKRLSFLLLYRLADCTASLPDTLKVRAHQAEFLDSLSSAELAKLGVIVEVMGQNYFTMTKNTLEATVSENSWTTAP
ncbi:uncharacterized protein LY89DRAFT_442635 [Mollisia scopiformis]|uniref:Uncharacterized protein n=1 Tax=Mollisia scopiformis TaxID=149040 RepID=A0A194XJS1_MOLSC|nr:uncharacterized protein LY89DRAFT_442635 [Mollisia scopiformis]KUJ20403.1 hypothetical protein LY89DRAFT_442635 [Mollisia scopiformis]